MKMVLYYSNVDIESKYKKIEFDDLETAKATYKALKKEFDFVELYIGSRLYK